LSVPELLWIELDVVATTLNSLQDQHREAIEGGNSDRAHDLQTQIDTLQADHDRLITQLFECMVGEIAESREAAD
jgi:hypothetical protein